MPGVVVFKDREVKGYRAYKQGEGTIQQLPTADWRCHLPLVYRFTVAWICHGFLYAPSGNVVI